jgi:hypothetical protein
MFRLSRPPPPPQPPPPPPLSRRRVPLQGDCARVRLHCRYLRLGPFVHVPVRAPSFQSHDCGGVEDYAYGHAACHRNSRQGAFALRLRRPTMLRCRVTLPSQVAAVVLVLYTDTVFIPPPPPLHAPALVLLAPSSPSFTDLDCRCSVLVLPSQQKRRCVMAHTNAAARGKASQ